MGAFSIRPSMSRERKREECSDTGWALNEELCLSWQVKDIIWSLVNTACCPIRQQIADVIHMFFISIFPNSHSELCGCWVGLKNRICDIFPSSFCCLMLMPLLHGELTQLSQSKCVHFWCCLYRLGRGTGNCCLLLHFCLCSYPVRSYFEAYFTAMS